MAGGVRVLGAVRRDGDPVARAHHRELALAGSGTDRADGAGACQHVDQRVEVAVPRHVKACARLNSGVRQGDRRVGRPGPCGRRSGRR